MEQPEHNKPTKLSWLQRRTIKLTLKKIQKEQKKLQEQKNKKETQQKQEKQQMDKAITQLLQIFDITHKGQKITTKNLPTINNKETHQIFQDAIKELQKIV